MKRVAELMFLIAASSPLLGACRKPPAPATVWAVENQAATMGLHATLRVSDTDVLPGERVDCELVVISPAATCIEPPLWKPAGLEPVDFAALPVTLDDKGRESHRWRWTFQAAGPGTAGGGILRLDFTTAETPGNLTLTVPEIIIKSAFPPGNPADTLPPLEEHHAP